MNSNAQKWVAALRSGEYTQGQEGLQTEQGYCCLGVACNLYMQETGLGRWLPPVVWEEDNEDNDESDSHQDRFYSFESDNITMDSFTLPHLVKDWLGMRTGDGAYRTVENSTEDNANGNDCSLTTLNDNGYSFAAIANIIEENDGLLFTDAG